MKARTLYIFTVLIIILIAGHCNAQITLHKAKNRDKSIILKCDTMTVKEGFALLNKIATGPLWYYNRRVVKNDTSYVRFGVTIFKKVYREDGKNLVRVKEYEL